MHTCVCVCIYAELPTCLCWPIVICMLQDSACGSSHHRSAPEAKRDPDSNTTSQIWWRMVDWAALPNFSVWYCSIPQGLFFFFFFYKFSTPGFVTYMQLTSVCLSHINTHMSTHTGCMCGCFCLVLKVIIASVRLPALVYCHVFDTSTRVGVCVSVCIV